MRCAAISAVSPGETHSMADFGPMKRRGPVSEEAHRERAAEHLIRFAVAGLNAP